MCPVATHFHEPPGHSQFLVLWQRYSDALESIRVLILLLCWEKGNWETFPLLSGRGVSVGCQWHTQRSILMVSQNCLNTATGSLYPHCHYKYPQVSIWAASLLHELEVKSTARLAGPQHTVVTAGFVYKPSLGEYVLRSLTCLIFSMIGLNDWEGHFIFSFSASENGRATVNASMKNRQRRFQMCMILDGAQSKSRTTRHSVSFPSCSL